MRWLFSPLPTWSRGLNCEFTVDVRTEAEWQERLDNFPLDNPLTISCTVKLAGGKNLEFLIPACSSSSASGEVWSSWRKKWLACWVCYQVTPQTAVLGPQMDDMVLTPALLCRTDTAKDTRPGAWSAPVMDSHPFVTLLLFLYISIHFKMLWLPQAVS